MFVWEVQVPTKISIVVQGNLTRTFLAILQLLAGYFTVVRAGTPDGNDRTDYVTYQYS